MRLGAKSVVQLEMMPMPQRSARLQSVARVAKSLKTDYGQEEAAAVYGKDPRVYQTTVSEFIKDEKGNVCKAKIVSLTPQKDEKTGRTAMVPVEGSEKLMDVQLVLIAAVSWEPEICRRRF